MDNAWRVTKLPAGDQECLLHMVRRTALHSARIPEFHMIIAHGNKRVNLNDSPGKTPTSCSGTRLAIDVTIPSTIHSG